jgi:hypothetical protein
MKRGKCLIDGAILMEATVQGPEHPHGPRLEVVFGLAKVGDEGQLETCGKVTMASPQSLDAWPDEVRTKFLELVEALEDHFVSTGGVFEETIEERVYVTVPAAVGGEGEPEEF